MKNCKPFVERNQSNAVAKVEAARDQIHQYFLDACAQEKVQALVLKSHPFSPTAWVKFECWVPHSSAKALSDRSSAVITFRPREFHRFEYEMDLEIQDGHKKKKYQSLYEFPPEEAVRIVRYLARNVHSRRLTLRLRCVRRNSLQLWRPKNKLVRIRRHRLRELARWIILIGFVMLASGYAHFQVALRISYIRYGVVVGPALMAIGVLMEITSYRGRSYVISSGKPSQEPRSLIRVDSWQTLVYELGEQAETVRAALKSELLKAQQNGFLLQDEDIWYWGIDGAEERKQTVVTFRRATGFLHVYRYANDLYVGWDAHVNCGAWGEKEIGSGVDPKSEQIIRLKAIEPGWHIPNDYDITDTNCLIEWIHGAVTKVVKRMLAEHKIDQEIDFQIIRGERQGIEGRQKPEEKRRSRFAAFRLKRQA